MAQPLTDNAPPFCLSIFGTDNRFNYSDVISRWNIINEMASKAGIHILGYASDGNTKLLKSMQIKANTQYSSFSPADGITREITYDTVHIGTKLRTRILKPNIILSLGNYRVSVSHLQQMTERFLKDRHLLTVTDLRTDDKMNFRSAEKRCSGKVTELLTNITESKRTVVFLKLMSNVLSSYLSTYLLSTRQLGQPGLPGTP